MRMRRVGMACFKVLFQHWCEYTDENCRNVTLGDVGVAFVTQTEYLAITSLGVYRCISFMLLIMTIVINILHCTLTHSLTTYNQILVEELKQN
jgi:hypothetical protein